MVTSGGVDLLKDIQSGTHDGDDEQPAKAMALNATAAVLPKSRTRNIDPIHPRKKLGRKARSVKPGDGSRTSERVGESISTSAQGDVSRKRKLSFSKMLSKSCEALSKPESVQLH